MDTFAILDDYLGYPYNPDLWSDDAKFYATNLLDNMNDVEWQRVNQAWVSRPIEWQVLLADAVFGSEKQRVLPLLVTMLKSPEPQVALAAAESLWGKDDIWQPDEGLRPILQRLRWMVGENNGTLNDLLARIISTQQTI